MMQIITWNIQGAFGVDNVQSISRIADCLHAFADADIVCCQEVFREYKENGEPTDDSQADELSRYFPDHSMFFGAAIDRAHNGGRSAFGNVIFSRLAIEERSVHKLPQPVNSSTRNMVRQATEIIVSYNGEWLRIITTHLEYFAVNQRKAQLDYLATLCLDSTNRAEAPPMPGVGTYQPLAETKKTIICGDFNMTPGQADYLSFTSQKDTPIIDSWRFIHPESDHLPTCGIFDHEQWPDGPHCRDFFFVTSDVQPSLFSMNVDTETSASDHQPVLLTLE